MTPAFRWRETSSLVDEEKTEVVVLPVACIEVPTGDEFVAVFPHTSGQTTETVSDCIARLEKVAERREKAVQEAPE
jgi:hypothetical protein